MKQSIRQKWFLASQEFQFLKIRLSLLVMPSLTNLVFTKTESLKILFTYEIITPELVGVKSNSLPLGKLSGRHAFVEKLRELALDFYRRGYQTTLC